MGVEAPDILSTMDRKPAVSSGSRPAASVSDAPRKAGESFTQFLNRSAVTRNGTSSADFGGTSLAGLLNQEQLPTDDDAAEQSPKAGESLTAFLNRQRKASAEQAPARLNGATRPATSASTGTSGASGSTGASAAGGTGAGRDALNRMKATDPAADRHAQAEKAAEGLVANALILPVLKQLRRSPFGEKGVFSGGIGEKTFGPEFDMQLADRIAQSPRLGVKEALVKRLESRGLASQARGTQSAKATRLDVNG